MSEPETRRPRHIIIALYAIDHNGAFPNKNSGRKNDNKTGIGWTRESCAGEEYSGGTRNGGDGVR